MSNNIRIVVIAEEDLKNLIRVTVNEEFEKIEKKLLERQVDSTAFGDKLRVKDVAAFLGCSAKTVTTYRKMGILPEPKIGLNRRPYWEKEEIIAAIKSNDLNWKYKL